MSFFTGTHPQRNAQIFHLQQASGCNTDINGDGIINVSDLLTIIDGWSSSGDCCPGCSGDVNGDLAVDVTDVLEVVGSWGMCQ